MSKIQLHLNGLWGQKVHSMAAMLTLNGLQPANGRKNFKQKKTRTPLKSMMGIAGLAYN
jgi:hypothetical protein